MTAPAVADQRVALQAVTAAAAADLASEWASLDLADAVAVKQALLDLFPALADEYGPAASELAADVYDSLREAAGITSGYEPQIADLSPKLDQWARWAADPLFSRQAAAQPRDGDLSQAVLLDRGQADREAAAFTRAQESVQKAVADQYRATITATAVEDDAADGWQRVVRPGSSDSGPCPFCVLLASRGAVYSTKTVDFAAHGLCHCLAVPAWGGQERPVKDTFVASSRNITAEDRARVYRYMRRNGLLGGKARGEA